MSDQARTVHNCAIRRKTGLTRTSELPKFNRRRKAKRKAENKVYGTYYVTIANLTTCVGQRGRVPHQCCYDLTRRPEAHHLHKVGNGGQDAANCVDVCHRMHDEFECRPLSEIEVETGLNMKAEAVRLYEEHGP